MTILSILLDRVNRHAIQFEKARDDMRQYLNKHYPHNFPYGQIGTDIDELAMTMTKTDQPLATRFNICQCCRFKSDAIDYNIQLVFQCSNTYTGTTGSHLQDFLSKKQNNRCHYCHAQLKQITCFHTAPPIIIYNINNNQLFISRKLELSVNDCQIVYKLRGIIYLGGFHFVSRIICAEGNI